MQASPGGVYNSLRFRASFKYHESEFVIEASSLGEGFGQDLVDDNMNEPGTEGDHRICDKTICGHEISSVNCRRDQ